jgi:alkylated DNA repair dioxygenase AlkB
MGDDSLHSIFAANDSEPAAKRVVFPEDMPTAPSESGQLALFGRPPGFPEGFDYRPHFISPDEEQALLAEMTGLPFREFEFQGYVGKRRVVSFGWQYVFDGSGLKKAEDMPGFLLPLRARAAAFAALEPEELQHVLLTEYRPGAPIGWHRDRSVFGETVGISLLSPCRFRFRRKQGAKWERAELIAEPRSAYLLKGPSRTEWEHSIPPVEALRYSITFRNLRK